MHWSYSSLAQSHPYDLKIWPYNLYEIQALLDYFYSIGQFYPIPSVYFHGISYEMYFKQIYGAINLLGKLKWPE